MINKKQIILLIIMFFTFIQISYWAQEYISKTIDWKKVSIIKVILDWKHKVITSLSTNGDSLETLVNKVWWVSWVNWAYFCPADYSQCWWVNSSITKRIYKWEILSNNFEDHMFEWKWDMFKVDEKIKYDFWWNWMFWFDIDWNPITVLNETTNFWFNEDEMNKIWIDKNHNSDKIPDIFYWIENYPMLLVDWKSMIKASSRVIEGKMLDKWTKTFICSKEDNKTILMWNVSNVTVEEMASFLKDSLECYNAMNLDSWGSLWMVYNKKNVSKPWRKIMDAFVVVETKNENSDKTNDKVFNETISPQVSDNNTLSENEKIYNEVKKQLELEKQQKLQEQLRQQKLVKKYESQLKKYYSKIDFIYMKDKAKIPEIKNKFLSLKSKYLSKPDVVFVLEKIIEYCNKKV